MLRHSARTHTHTQSNKQKTADSAAAGVQKHFRFHFWLPKLSDIYHKLLILVLKVLHCLQIAPLLLTIIHSCLQLSIKLHLHPNYFPRNSGWHV